MEDHFDIIVIGAGLVGLSAALAAAESGLSAALIDGRDIAHIPADGRASALAASSMRMLTRLGADIVGESQPFEDVLITEGLSYSPWRVHFDSQDHGEPTAFMIENQRLYAALLRAAGETSLITLFSSQRVSAWAFEADKAVVTLQSGQALSAPLIIAADGRNSATRQAAGIVVTRKTYDQAALVTTIAHELPHDGLALQRFLPGGPLAVLPLTGARSHIVWSDKREAINAAIGLDEAALLSLLSERIGDHLGALRLDAPRQSYPLSQQMAERLTGPRLVLVGEAAHAIHPLAGQGLNLGLRDVAALMDGVSAARANGQDIGTAGLLDYETWRRGDIQSLAQLTDIFSGVFTAQFPLTGHIRRAGMAMINQARGLKRVVMRDAAGDLGDLPRLLQR